MACAANGWVGATYGINFPTFARAVRLPFLFPHQLPLILRQSQSFGIRGTAVAVLCRAVAAIVWFGTQTYQGGQCVNVRPSLPPPRFKLRKGFLHLDDAYRHLAVVRTFP